MTTVYSRHQHQWYFCLMLAIVLSVAGCGGLAGEPRIVATIPPATPAPTDVGYPQIPPDVAVGAQIYTQHCTQCHGDTGKGDGTLIGNGDGQIPQTPPDFTNPVTTAKDTPLDWFNIITNGRMDNYMPPWQDTLSEQERWDVAMYVYMLHGRADAIAQGKSLLETNSAKTDTLPPQSDLINLTDTGLLAKFAENAPFVTGLGDNDKQAVAYYLRSLTLANGDLIGKTAALPAATEEANGTSVPVITGMVTGQVTNGTAAASVPSGLKVTLHILDSQFQDSPLQADLSDDGHFTFNDVPFRTDRNYIATVVYEERTFASDFLTADPAVGKLDLPLKIYEITDDASVILIAGWVSQITVVEGVLQIAQVVSFTNTSDKAYSTTQLPNDDRYASVQVKLPPGAQVLSITPDDQRYVVGLDGTTIIDTAPVVPGEQHIVQFVYSVPYTGELQFEQTLGYALQGPVRLLMSPDSLKVVSEQLVPLGPQAIRDQTYQGYGASLTLSASDVLRYRVEGAAPSGTSGTSSANSANNVLPIILILVGVAAIVIAGIVYFRGRKPVPQSAAVTDSTVLIDGLIRQIAELDDSYAAGQVDEDTYQKRRSKLKERLAELMDK